MNKSFYLIFIFLVSCNTEHNRVDLSEFKSLKKLTPSLAIDLDLPSSSEIEDLASNSSYAYMLGADSSFVYRISKKDLSIVSIHNLHGTGPGEVAKPSFLAVSENRVLISDKDDMIIQIYDTSLTHLESIQVNGLVNSLDVIGNDFFLVSFLELGQSRLQIYDTKLLKTFTIEADSDHPLDIVGEAKFIDKDTFMFIRNYSNEIFKIEVSTGNQSKYQNPYLPEKSETKKELNILIPLHSLLSQALTSDSKLYALTGVILSEGQPIFRFNKNGIIEDAWVFNPEDQIGLFAVNGNSLLTYSYINNTLSKYEL